MTTTSIPVIELHIVAAEVLRDEHHIAHSRGKDRRNSFAGIAHVPEKGDPEPPTISKDREAEMKAYYQEAVVGVTDRAELCGQPLCHMAGNLIEYLREQR